MRKRFYHHLFNRSKQRGHRSRLGGLGHNGCLHGHDAAGSEHNEELNELRQLHHDTAIILIEPNESQQELAQYLRDLGGYQKVEILEGDYILPLAKRLIKPNTRRLLVIPSLQALSDPHLEPVIKTQIKLVQEEFPKCDVSLVPVEINLEDHARVLFRAAERHEHAQEWGDSIPLSRLQKDEMGDIQTLVGGSGFVARLAALGFVPNSRVRMIQNRGIGPIIVEVQHSRIAIGRSHAYRIRVNYMEPDSDTEQGKQASE